MKESDKLKKALKRMRNISRKRRRDCNNGKQLQHARVKVEEALEEWGEEEEGLIKFLKGLKDEEQEVLR